MSIHFKNIKNRNFNTDRNEPEVFYNGQDENGNWITGGTTFHREVLMLVWWDKPEEALTVEEAFSKAQEYVSRRAKKNPNFLDHLQEMKSIRHESRYDSRNIGYPMENCIDGALDDFAKFNLKNNEAGAMPFSLTHEGERMGWLIYGTVSRINFA